jgi:hypothetical protein
MQMNLFPQSCATQGFVAFNGLKPHKKNYCNQRPIDQFLHVVIEIFGCLHKQVDVLHDFTNVIWNLRELKGNHLFVLVIFLYQKISITLQRMQTSSILS